MQPRAGDVGVAADHFFPTVAVDLQVGRIDVVDAVVASGDEYGLAGVLEDQARQPPVLLGVVTGADVGEGADAAAVLVGGILLRDLAAGANPAPSVVRGAEPEDGLEAGTVPGEMAL